MQPTQFSRFLQGLAPHAFAFCAALGALGGAGLYFGLPYEPSPWVGVVLAVCSLIFLSLAKNRAVWGYGVFLVFAAAAFVLAQAQVMRATPVDYAAGQKPHWLVGEVVEVHIKPENPKRAVLRMKDVELFGLRAEHVARGSVGVATSQTKGVEVGNTVAVRTILLPPEPPKYEGQRDSRIWRYFDDARVAGYAVGPVEVTEREKEGGFKDTFLEWLEGVREQINDATKDKAGGAVTALLTGEEKWVTRDVRDAYRETGLSHLLAISGMQLTLVGLGLFGLFVWLLSWVPGLALRVNIRALAALGAMAGVVFYTFLAGASVSLVRATVMSLLVLLAIVTGRMSSGLRAWCVAVVLIILINPVMVLRAGFQLSAVAVLGLLLLAHSGGPAGRRGWVWWLKEMTLATVVAGAATAPVVMANFGQFSVVGLLGNLVAIPLMTIATYLGMVALAVWPLGLQAWPLEAMAYVVQGVNDWALVLSGWTFASVNLPKGLWWVLVPFAALSIGGVLAKHRAWATAGVVGMTLAAIGMAQLQPKPDVLVWDNGQVGLARVGDVYRPLWAVRGVDDMQWMVRGSGLMVEVNGEVSRVVDARFMPISGHEDFAWARKTAGQWYVEPVACKRPWQQLAAACWK